MAAQAAMRRTDRQFPVKRRLWLQPFRSAATLPLNVYRDFIDMLFSMRLPIAGLGIIFTGACLSAAFQINGPVYFVLATLCAVTTFVRLHTLRRYARAAPVPDIKSLRIWERRYAIGNYASAAQLGLLNIVALSSPYPVWHLITISLVFSFCAGIMARTSVRPKICVISLLLATVPTIIALVFHAFQAPGDLLHVQMYLIEAVLMSLIAALGLQIVAHLYRSAVTHHTARYDLTRLAKFDALTGLPNRLLLRECFDETMAVIQHTNEILAVHFLDLDGFKSVNDQHGHPVGDALLEQVAHRLESIVRSGDTVARLGGDEFIVLQNGLRQEAEAELLARRIIRQLSLPYYIGNVTAAISVSVGIACAPRQGVDLDRLLACADAALYCAKAGGKAQALFCTDDNAANLNLAA